MERKNLSLVFFLMLFVLFVSVNCQECAKLGEDCGVGIIDPPCCKEPNVWCVGVFWRSCKDMSGGWD